MDWVDRTKEMFTRANEDLAKLLKITNTMAEWKQTNPELQQKALAQMETILGDAEAIGGGLIQEVKTIKSELKDYLKHPSETGRIKVMKNTMNIKHKVREL